MEKLLGWKGQSKRKPLILMGARQVGKTFVLKKFGEQEYENTVYLDNFRRGARVSERIKQS